MSKYRRAKREDYIEPRSQKMSISIGSVKDDYESLITLCKDKSVELLKIIDLGDSEEMAVVFGTEDFPEIIGVSTFSKNDAGLLTFSFDDSESTL